VNFFIENGIKAIHGSEILDGWRTKDADFCRYADDNRYTIISKDRDFLNSHFLKGTPKSLIKINLGNISNNELLEIFSENLRSIKSTVENNKIVVIEINIDSINVLEK
jgi:predicted nuclease of predicted toxin-antitoxin system